MKFNNIELLIEDKNVKVTSIEIANILKQENFTVNRKIKEEWDYCTVIQKWMAIKDKYQNEINNGVKTNHTYYTMESDMALYIISRFNNQNAKEAMCEIIKALRQAQDFINESGYSEEFSYYRETGKIVRRNLTDIIKEVC